MTRNVRNKFLKRKFIIYALFNKRNSVKSSCVQQSEKNYITEENFSV